MKNLLSVLFIFIFTATQAFASYPTYEISILGKTTLPDGRVIDLINSKLVSGSEAASPGETVIIKWGNEVYQGTYEGVSNSSNGEIPVLRPDVFLGHAKTTSEAQKMGQEGISVEDGAAPSSPAEGGANAGSGTGMGSPLDGFAKGAGQIGMQALMSGAIAGASVAISRGLIYTDDVQKYFENIQNKIQESQDRIEDSQTRIENKTIESLKTYAEFIKSVGEIVQDPLINGNAVQAASGRSLEFQSQNPKFVKDLIDIQTTLDGSKLENSQQQTAQNLGYGFVDAADSSYANGSFSDAYAFRNYALAMADIAVGLDPVTGTIRSVYEAFSGRNLITGEDLTLTERSFAVVGALSFGYGNKMGQGFKALSKFVGQGRFGRSILAASERAQHLVKNNFITKAFRERKLDQYYDGLRKTHNGAYQELRQHFDKFPEVKEKYLTYLKDREGVTVKYWQDGDQSFKLIEQEKSIRALQELDKALDKNAILMRQGGDSWTAQEKLKYVQKYGELPPYSTRVNINTTNIKEAPVHWGLVKEGEDVSSLANEYGLYSKGDAFTEYAKIKSGAQVVTRAAESGSYFDPITKQMVTTYSKKIEVVVEHGGAETFKFVVKH